MFGWNSHRLELFADFKLCLIQEIRPIFFEPIYFDGSYVTDKAIPDDIDMFLEFEKSSEKRKLEGLLFMSQHQERLLTDYRVHFLINFPGARDFRRFFQYVGPEDSEHERARPKT